MIFHAKETFPKLNGDKAAIDITATMYYDFDLNLEGSYFDKEFIRNHVILLSNIMEKPAGNCCLFVKTCAFFYTHILNKVYQRMLSIFDRNITFLLHLYILLEKYACS